MNKSLVYSNVMLTVIAALLGVIAFRIAPLPMASGPMQVTVVGATKSLPVTFDSAELRKAPLPVTVDFAELRKTPLAVTLPAGPLPVAIAGAPLKVTLGTDPLPVTLGKAPVPVSFGAAPLPVIIAGTSQNIPVAVMATPTPKAPLEVKVVNADDRPVRLSGPVDVNIVQVAGDRVPAFNGGRLEVKVGSN